MNQFVRGAKISRAIIPYDKDLTAQEAAFVTVELWKKENPKVPDGDFIRYMLRVWDAHTEASKLATVPNPEGNAK
jgi:hypothetical protein